MAGELSANLAAQRDFVANASHQLGRRSRASSSGSRPSGPKEGPAAEQAAKAEGELDRLSALVDDLLALARAAADRAPGGARRPRRGGAGRRKAVGAPAAEAGHDLAVADGSGGRIWAAPPDVAHILDNLLENAIRYSPEGSRIEVALEPDAGRPGFVVSDTGPGIPASERGHVFERFYRGAEGRSAGPGRVSASPSSQSWPSAGTAPSSSWTAPARECARAFRQPAADSSPPANHS